MEEKDLKDTERKDKQTKIEEPEDNEEKDKTEKPTNEIDVIVKKKMDASKRVQNLVTLINNETDTKMKKTYQMEMKVLENRFKRKVEMDRVKEQNEIGRKIKNGGDVEAIFGAKSSEEMLPIILELLYIAKQQNIPKFKRVVLDEKFERLKKPEHDKESLKGFQRKEIEKMKDIMDGFKKLNKPKGETDGNN